MEFDFFSLWFVYYPVSGILWLWHTVFGAVLGADNGFAWALSVLFMTFTIRLLLVKPFVSQMRSMRKMQEFSPQIKKLQEKYKNDKQKLAEEMQKLQREHGVNPLGGCLPILVQLPVFIGLFHVLKGFNETYPFNYVFSRADIQSFLAGDIFGVTLDQAIKGSLQTIGGFDFFGGEFNAAVMPVAIPLMIVSAVATHFTARISQQHQSAAAAANPQAAIMAKLTMWVFPIGVLVFGALLPVAILLYWLSNNSWTLCQQYFVYKKIAREEEEKKELAREQRDNLAPRPGQKPGQGSAPRPGQRPASKQVDAGAADDGSSTPDGPVDAVSSNGASAANGEHRAGTGKRSPGKVGGNGASTNGKGSGRSSPGKVGGGKKGGKNGQLASSGQTKRPKKRR